MDTKKLEPKYLEGFEMWFWRRMENIKWSEKVTNEQVLDRIGDKTARKGNWIGHILRRMMDAIEVQTMEVKGVCSINQR